MAKDKDKKPILFDDIEWGNQETDSVSHEDILNIDWGRKKTLAEKEHQSKKMSAKYNEEEYKTKWQKSNSERWEDPEWKEQHIDKMKAGRTEEVEQARIEALRNSEKRKKAMAKRWADPEWRKKISKINSERVWTKEQRENLSKRQKGKKIPKKVVEKREKTKLDLAMSNQKVNKQCRSINTPDGVFHNLRLASQHFGVSKDTIINRCKNTKNTKFTDWYYLD
jgi:hypothetical protein